MVVVGEWGGELGGGSALSLLLCSHFFFVPFFSPCLFFFYPNHLCVLPCNILHLMPNRQSCTARRVTLVLVPSLLFSSRLYLFALFLKRYAEF